MIIFQRSGVACIVDLVPFHPSYHLLNLFQIITLDSDHIFLQSGPVQSLIYHIREIYSNIRPFIPPLPPLPQTTFGFRPYIPPLPQIGSRSVKIIWILYLVLTASSDQNHYLHSSSATGKVDWRIDPRSLKSIPECFQDASSLLHSKHWTSMMI